MGEIAAAGTASYSLLIYVEDELIVCAHVHAKRLRRLRKVNCFAEVQHYFISLRSVGSGDPLGGPEL